MVGSTLLPAGRAAAGPAGRREKVRNPYTGAVEIVRFPGEPTEAEMDAVFSAMRAEWEERSRLAAGRQMALGMGDLRMAADAAEEGLLESALDRHPRLRRLADSLRQKGAGGIVGTQTSWWDPLGAAAQPMVGDLTDEMVARRILDSGVRLSKSEHSALTKVSLRRGDSERLMEQGAAITQLFGPEALFLPAPENPIVLRLGSGLLRFAGRLGSGLVDRLTDAVAGKNAAALVRAVREAEKKGVSRQRIAEAFGEYGAGEKKWVQSALKAESQAAETGIARASRSRKTTTTVEDTLAGHVRRNWRQATEAEVSDLTELIDTRAVKGKTLTRLRQVRARLRRSLEAGTPDSAIESELREEARNLLGEFKPASAAARSSAKEVPTPKAFQPRSSARPAGSQAAEIGDRDRDLLRQVYESYVKAGMARSPETFERAKSLYDRAGGDAGKLRALWRKEHGGRAADVPAFEGQGGSARPSVPAEAPGTQLSQAADKARERIRARAAERAKSGGLGSKKAGAVNIGAKDVKMRAEDLEDYALIAADWLLKRGKDVAKAREALRAETGLKASDIGKVLARASELLGRQRAAELIGEGSRFPEVRSVLKSEFPKLPRERMQRVFAAAMEDYGAPIASRLDKAGESIPHVPPSGVTVPLQVQRELEQASDATALRGFWTEARLVERTLGREQPPRAARAAGGDDPFDFDSVRSDPSTSDTYRWLIEDREKRSTAAIDETVGWLARMRKEVPLSVRDREASRLIMDQAEGKLGREVIKSRHRTDWRKVLRTISFAELQALGVAVLKKARPKDWQKIVAESQWYRDQFEFLFKRINAERRKLGVPEVRYHENYFTHIRQEASLWDRLRAEGGSETGGAAGEVLREGTPSPTTSRKSQGVSVVPDEARPSRQKPWYEKRREGEEGPYLRDAARAFEKYVQKAMYEVHMTEAIMRRRSLADLIRRSEMKDSLEGFARTLDTHADVLAGSKRSAIDTAVLKIAGEGFGDTVLRGIGWLTRREGANRIVGNVATTLMQTAQLAPGIAEAGLFRIARGFYEEAAAALGKARNATEASPFLRRRYADIRTVAPTRTQKGGKLAAWPMEAVEQTVTQAVWRGVYRKGLDQGLAGEAAVSFADRWTERIVAGRAFGEKPSAYRGVSEQALLQFQLEVGNFVQYLAHDFGKGMSRGQKAWKGAKLMGALYAMNSLYEWTMGRTPLPDPIRLGIDVAEISSGDEEVPDKIREALARVAGEAASALPASGAAVGAFGLTDVQKKRFFGETEVGRYPAGLSIASPIRSAASGKYGNVVYELVLPFGGSQVKKTTEGVAAVLAGGVANQRTKSEEDFRFVIDDLGEQVRAILFGPWATQAGQGALKDKK